MFDLAALVVIALVGLMSGTDGQLNAPENCKILSECFQEGERYYNQYDSLRNESDNLKAQPKTELDKCNAELYQMRNQAERLSSKRREAYADCVLQNAANATIANTTTEKNKTQILYAAYKNSSVNQPGQLSSTDAVKLTTCRCDQSIQVANYSIVCKNKRASCDSFSGACSIYSSVCTKKINDPKLTPLTLQINDLNGRIANKTKDCSIIPKARR